MFHRCQSNCEGKRKLKCTHTDTDTETETETETETDTDTETDTESETESETESSVAPHMGHKGLLGSPCILLVYTFAIRLF